MPAALGLSHLGSGLPAVTKSTDAWRARRILVSVERRQCSFVGRGKMGKQTALGLSAESKLQEALNAAVVGHQGCVNAIAWNAKGSLLISGSDDTRIYDVYVIVEGDISKDMMEGMRTE
ncbi:uncharacterized protein LOC122030598 [Zingiber officinale]|uniref:uncharacterized protein LOC122030598 n=1 Tax=Zingiber officinale TaxID=94328 RepID=UPI001C4AE5FB|nr:uncharacterized protein LOC122030598 [Zingiber officinale]